MEVDPTTSSPPPAEAKKVVSTRTIAVDPSEFPHLLKQFYER